MQTKPTFDPNSPEIRAYLNEVHHGTFVREGTMVAFPTCFPGMTLPIAHDESRITALDITPEGVIYGGASGRQAHLFVANFHGLTGVVFDLGAPAGATQCAAVCAAESRLVAFVNGPRGGRAYRRRLEPIDSDCIQEWGFERPAFDDLGECAPGEAIVHAVPDLARSIAVGVTTGHLFTVDPGKPELRTVGEVPAGGRIAVGSKGGVFGRDGERALWRFDPQSRKLQRQAVALPGGKWSRPLVWARDNRTGLLYAADADSNLFSFDEAAGFSSALGRAPLAPAGPMAVTHDGRLFGFCGLEMANLFCYDPVRREVANLGVAASILERRRYGYAFGDAVTGRDGEIVFGENDDGGHLWVYFPRIRPAA